MNKKIIFFCNYTCHHTCENSIYNPFYKNPNHLVLYNNTDINHDSNFALNLHLHSHDSCWNKKLVSFTLDIKFFNMQVFTLFGTQTQAYRSSTVLQLPPHFLTPTVNE